MTSAFHYLMSLPAQLAGDEELGPPRARLTTRLIGAAGALLAVALIGWLDSRVPNDMALVLLYLVPIAACGWWLGGRVAGAVALAAGLAFLLADLKTRAPMSVGLTAWHTFTSLTVFLALGLAAARIRVAQARLAAANRQLERHLELETALARTDPHTGLPNLRAFLDHLRIEIARRRRDGRPFAVACIDLDNFKQVNDVYGHGAGDAFLAQVGLAIRDAVRGGDVFARIGGDEFAVAFAETARADVEAITARIARRIRAVGAAYPAAPTDSSIGIAFFSQVPDDPEAIMHCADAAMYRAKAAGKGLIESSDEDAVEWAPEEVTGRYEVPPSEPHVIAEVDPGVESGPHGASA